MIKIQDLEEAKGLTMSMVKDYLRSHGWRSLREESDDPDLWRDEKTQATLKIIYEARWHAVTCIAEHEQRSIQSLLKDMNTSLKRTDTDRLRALSRLADLLKYQYNRSHDSQVRAIWRKNGQIEYRVPDEVHARAREIGYAIHAACDPDLESYCSQAFRDTIADKLAEAIILCLR